MTAAPPTGFGALRAPGLGSVPAEPAPSGVQVFGPWNSGTGLMFAYAHRLAATPTRFHLAFHKHVLPPHWERHDETDPDHDGHGPTAGLLRATLLVGMVRYPAFWLSSMVRRPYDVRFLDDPGDDHSARLRSRIRVRDRAFADLPELWNAYYRAYRRHLEGHGAVYVRLEDLVAEPLVTVQDLVRVAGRRGAVDPAGTVEEIRETPAKVHGDPCWAGRAAANRYSLENLPALWAPEDLAYIDERIEVDLRTRFGYPAARAPTADRLRPRPRERS